MLTIYGQKQRFCDGVSRRQFLKIGGFALGSLGGLTLTDVLRAEALPRLPDVLHAQKISRSCAAPYEPPSAPPPLPRRR